MKEAIRVIDPVEKAVDLGTQLSPRIRMIRVASELDRHPVIDRCHPAAGIGAVVMAGAEDSFHRQQARSPGARNVQSTAAPRVDEDY
jgi:hypothetical protein